MARFKVWILVFFCLALTYLALTGSPKIGIAAPKPPPPATATVVRVNYSLAATKDATIELPANVPIHVMITETSRRLFTWVDLVRFDLPGTQQIFANGFDLMDIPANPTDPLPHVLGNVGGGHLLWIGPGRTCVELIAASATAIAVHNRDLDLNFQTCPQTTGTVTLI